MYFIVYMCYKTAKLGMNLAVVITKFGFFRVFYANFHSLNYYFRKNKLELETKPPPS